MALQRELGALVVLHAAAVAAQKAACASYHVLACELPMYVPPEQRSHVPRPLSMRATRSCFAVSRALEKNELTKEMAGKFYAVHSKLLSVLEH
ncbi:MAG: hypothetical protein MHM6MM_001028 [Cercozoa sp. M6MM]